MKAGKQKYSLPGWATRALMGRWRGKWIGLALALSFGGVVGAGCTGFADQVREEDDRGQEGVEIARTLYESMIEVFEEETPGVDLALESHLTVVSHYEEIEELRRRRFTGRVLPVGRGIGVKITAQYQIGEKGAEGTTWEEERGAEIEAEAAPEELRLARRVERKYHERASSSRRERRAQIISPATTRSIEGGGKEVVAEAQTQP